MVCLVAQSGAVSLTLYRLTLGLFLNHHNMTEIFQDIYHLECRDNSKVSELVKDGKKVRNVVEMGIKWVCLPLEGAQTTVQTSWQQSVLLERSMLYMERSISSISLRQLWKLQAQLTLDIMRPHINLSFVSSLFYIHHSEIWMDNTG